MAATLTLEQITAWVKKFSEVIAENREYLTGLDSEIGDADHGSNMTRGTAAAVEKITADAPATIAAFGKAVGMTLVSTVGGASGPLFGTLFLRFGVAAGETTELDANGFAAALKAGIDGVVARGKAELGDKTMVDVLLPTYDALVAATDAGDDLAAALEKAATAAAEARDATEPLIAKKGRASYLGDRSAGHIDPGSASTAIMFATLAEVAK